MKYLTLIFWLLFTSALAKAGNSDSLVRPPNNISLHLLGDGSLGAIYYERLFQLGPGSFLSGSAGIGLMPQLNIFDSEPSPPDITLINHLTIIFGRKKGGFEAGLGGTWVNDPAEPHYFVYPILGFRIQPFNANQLNFRAFVSYPFDGFSDLPYLPLGVSFGLVF
jgi:hypothetical protein